MTLMTASVPAREPLPAVKSRQNRSRRPKSGHVGGNHPIPVTLGIRGILGIRRPQTSTAYRLITTRKCATRGTLGGTLAILPFATLPTRPRWPGHRSSPLSGNVHWRADNKTRVFYRRRPTHLADTAGVIQDYDSSCSTQSEKGHRTLRRLYEK